MNGAIAPLPHTYLWHVQEELLPMRTHWPHWLKSVRSGSWPTFVATNVKCQRGISCIVFANLGDSLTKGLLWRGEEQQSVL
jgi:hypothetical protein